MARWIGLLWLMGCRAGPEAWFRTSREPLPYCAAPEIFRQLDATLEVQIVSTVSDKALLRTTRGLQHYFDPYQLALTTELLPVELAGPSIAVSGTEEGYLARLDDLELEGVPEEEQERQRAVVLIDEFFSGVRAVRLGNPSDVLQILVVDRVADDGAAAYLELERVLGLTFNTAKSFELSTYERALVDEVLPPESGVGGMMIVAVTDIEADGVQLQTVAAHELGHALGLDHVDLPDNLMQPSASPEGACVPVLDDDQVIRMREQLAPTARPPPALGGEPPSQERARAWSAYSATRIAKPCIAAPFSVQVEGLPVTEKASVWVPASSTLVRE